MWKVTTGQWQKEESECTSHSQQKIKPLKVRWKAHVLHTLKISFEHWVRIVLKVEERPNSTRLSRWVIFSVSVSSLVCSSVLLSISPKHLYEYNKYNVSKQNLKVLLSSSCQAFTCPSLTYLSINCSTKSSNSAVAEHNSLSTYSFPTQKKHKRLAFLKEILSLFPILTVSKTLPIFKWYRPQCISHWSSYSLEYTTWNNYYISFTLSCLISWPWCLAK